MKPEFEMLEKITVEICENVSLLELIIYNAPDLGVVDNQLACLMRSMQKTSEKAYEYISNYDSNAEAIK